MRRAILIFALLGAGLFAGAFFVSYTRPMAIERAAREIVRMEVQRRVDGRIEELGDSRIAAFARKALHRNDAEMVAAQDALRAAAAAKVGEVAENMLRGDCACRFRLHALFEEARKGRIAFLGDVHERLTHLVEIAYATTARNLQREFRIFTLTNAAAFALLALVAYVRKGAKLQLLLPALVLVGAVVVTGGLYLFSQDWLHTIVFADYLGWGYTAYVSLVALLLADILMNHARVTTPLVNAAAELLGAAATAVPC
jgi:hypothetical protein